MIKTVLSALCAMFAMSAAFAGPAHAQDYTGTWYGAVNWEGAEYDGDTIVWEFGRGGSFTDSHGEGGTWSTTTTGVVLRYVGGGQSVYTGDLVGPTTLLGWMTNGEMNGQFVLSRNPLGTPDNGGGGIAVAAGGVPEGFNIDPARAVLRGDVSQLISAFVWGGTPQGHDYWSDFHGQGRPLTPEARAAVQGWINNYEASEGGGGDGPK